MLHLALFAGAASAAPCDDALEHLAAGAPPSAVAAVASADAWDEAGVGCLVEHGAPRRVVVAAARAGGLVPPTDPTPRPFELALGGAWIPDRGLATPGTVDLHLTWLPRPEVALELAGSVGVNPGSVDYKPFSKEIIAPSPGLLRDELAYLGAATVQFAPLAGEVSAGGRPIGIRLYALTGGAAVRTVDDVDGALQKSEDPAFIATRVQTHPALVYGGGLRVSATERLGVRLQVDETRWIEVYEGTTLAMNHRVAASVLGTLRL